MTVLGKYDRDYLNKCFTSNVITNSRKYLISDLKSFTYLKLNNAITEKTILPNIDYHFGKRGDNNEFYYVTGYNINTHNGVYWLPVLNFMIQTRKEKCIKDIKKLRKKI